MTSATGRPSKLNTDIQVKIVEAIKMGCFPETACSSASISRKTFYNWINRGKEIVEELENDPERPLIEEERLYLGFYTAVEKAMAEAEYRAIGIIQRAAMNNDWKASCWYLERRFPDRWSRKERLDIESRSTERKEVIIQQGIDEDPESVELMKQLYRRQTAINSNAAAERNKSQLAIDHDI